MYLILLILVHKRRVEKSVTDPISLSFDCRELIVCSEQVLDSPDPGLAKSAAPVAHGG
jgi:hypothetical protein